jgi:transposase InsO family protein
MSTPARSSGRAFSPLGSFQQVSAQETQRFLREQFTLWGRPALLRVDNGTPWGASGGLPTALVMWAAGADVDTHHNDPRRPQQNGVIERSHGTNKRWAEPWLCDSAKQLQQRTDEAAVRQRERYPYGKGKSRLEVFPALRHSGRPYKAGWEKSNWSLELALAALAEIVEVRQVDQSGHVSLYSRNVYVGRSWAGSAVYA